MLKYMEFTAKTEDEAIAKGLAYLGLDRDDVSVEILDRGRTGFLGIGSVPAKVKLTYEAPDEPKPEVQPQAAAPMEEKPAPAPRPERPNPPRAERPAPKEQPKPQSRTAQSRTAQPAPTFSHLCAWFPRRQKRT